MSKRMVEVRLVVIAIVDLGAPALAPALAATGGKPVSVPEAVSAEIASHLHTVQYVELVVVSPL